jgi:hypothetical protein
LDPDTHLKIITLIREKSATLPTRAAIAALYQANSNATDKFDVTMDGKVVAKYCLHCGRYTKGKTVHSSAEHKGKTYNPRPGGTPAPAPAPAPAAAGAVASFPRPNVLQPPSAPVATVASFPDGFDLSSVPVVDTDSFLCQPADYDTPVMLMSILEDTDDLFDFLYLNDGGR